MRRRELITARATRVGRVGMTTPGQTARFVRIMNLVLEHDSRPAVVAAGADGVAASPGVHTGPVRVVHGPDDFAKVQAGDVLVAPMTTSPWEVLFPHI